MVMERGGEAGLHLENLCGGKLETSKIFILGGTTSIPYTLIEHYSDCCID